MKEKYMNAIITTSNGNLLSTNTQAGPAYKPARQPGGKRKAPHRRITYLNIPTLQNDLIICESNLERDCALVIALNPEVVRIECQPETIDLGAYGEYTPDFRVIYKSAPPSYVEVKPTIFAYEKKMWAKICAAFEYYKSQGIHYEWMSDWEIEKKDRHLRAAYIHRCAKLLIPVEQSQKIIQAASNYPQGIRMDDLQAITGLLTDHILHCVGLRQLKLNHFFDYSLESLVFPLKGECK
jgi:hypothetical protein